MTSFATISLDDYKKLVDNKKKYLIYLKTLQLLKY